MRPRRTGVLLEAWVALLGSVLAASAFGAAGVAVEGTDRARVQVPVSALVEPYENSGYRLTMHDGVADVEIALEPLGTNEPFRLPTRLGQDPVGKLTRSLLVDVDTRYEAVSRILSWIAREIRYDLDREQSQEPNDLLERRSGYCTGIARLTVAVLGRAGIPAREVAGLVVDGATPRAAATYHRWVEVEYSDGRWAYSDPTTTHHYVPANYVRLASERLLPLAEKDPALLRGRQDDRRIVDLAPLSPPGVSTRRNDARQLAGALEVRVEGATTGVAVLEGLGHRRVKSLIGGNSTFVGLQPGTYLLTVMVDGHQPVEHRLVLYDHVREAIYLSMS